MAGGPHKAFSFSRLGAALSMQTHKLLISIYLDYTRKYKTLEIKHWSFINIFTNECGM